MMLMQRGVLTNEMIREVEETNRTRVQILERSSTLGSGNKVVGEVEEVVER